MYVDMLEDGAAASFEEVSVQTSISVVEALWEATSTSSEMIEVSIETCHFWSSRNGLNVV